MLVIISVSTRSPQSGPTFNRERMEGKKIHVAGECTHVPVAISVGTRSPQSGPTFNREWEVGGSQADGECTHVLVANPV